jgi:hypothetical protein
MRSSSPRHRSPADVEYSSHAENGSARPAVAETRHDRSMMASKFRRFTSSFLIIGNDHFNAACHQRMRATLG